MQIRRGRSSDASRLWELRRIALRQGAAGYYPADILMAWTGTAEPEALADHSEQHFHVMSDGETIWGCIALNLETSHIDAMFVDPARSGQGIGRQLMEHIFQFARASGKTHLTLEATLNAVPFYQSCGFIGHEISTYHSPAGYDLDCIPMRYTL
ncbi:GNAT family N-acetyltransferase [Burkholderiaceae bacterium DAT-1]|nr:GNAT family N-acetyltransferase [Burkholderiaceae bacterium DAT-1]